VRPKEFVAGDHEIDPTHVDSDALYILQKLKEAGHTAYLVGGSVRDLLVHREPKDFDISTSARPQEIKRIFKRNCFLIGKRFRLAHIRFGKKIIEVSTFRSGENDSDLIIRDNTWGTEEEDVIRRDFTINGLFYDPFEHKVIDYVGGWEDIHKGLLRSIGNPTIRFKQDPVRMLRLIKFRARFGFEIEEETKQALISSRKEITKSSPARILEEILRMLESGSSAQFIHLMTQSKMLHLLFPPLTDFIESKNGKVIFELLHVADQIHRQKPVQTLTRPILASCLLFPILEREIKMRYTDQDKNPHLGDVMLAASDLLRHILISSFSHFPRKLTTETISIMTMQYRLTPPSGKHSIRHKSLSMKEFPESLQFLKMRAVLNPELLNPYKSWNNAWKQHLKKGVHQRHHHPPPQAKDHEENA
jgi:poly(A) polymerase